MTSLDELSAFDALISSFRDSFGNAVVVELERYGECELASALRRALDGPDAAAAEYAIERTYTALQTHNVWPTPAWSECYVLAQLRRCVELLRGGGTDAREAQRALDMTLIFGAPSEPLRGLIDAAERACFAGDADTRLTYVRSARASGLLFPDEPPATSAGGRGDMLERVEGTELTTKEFKQRFYSTDTPVVLANLGKDWRALRVWDDLEWWKRFHGHRCVPLELGRYADASSWREDVKTMREFVDEYLIPSLRDDSQNIAYLAQHQLIDQLIDLRRDFEVPALCAKSLERINAWMGTAGTITPCHFDTYDNLLGQVRASRPLYHFTFRALLARDQIRGFQRNRPVKT